MTNTRPQYPEIGQRLAELRLGLSDLNQADWAAQHGFSKTRYNNWETGERRTSLECAEYLADRYGLTLDWIYRGRSDGLSENVRKLLSRRAR